MKKLIAVFLSLFFASGVALAAADGYNPIAGVPIANPTPIATYNGPDQINDGPKSGVKIVVDITSVAGGATLTVRIQGKDPVSGKYFTMLTSTALGAAATTVLTIFPGATAAANVTVNDRMPRTWRISYDIGTATTIAATIGGILLD